VFNWRRRILKAAGGTTVWLAGEAGGGTTVWLAGEAAGEMILMLPGSGDLFPVSPTPPHTPLQAMLARDRSS
jgi:hypothetical protein